ncbi:MAG TPA: glutathione S-transferase N-terminal domain-containing protein [Xanthobacteraceae bacterium]|jgi:glutathione S-transferase|nr:glutathione S-transferase N-terminal domain-containing protein [Xanthobacteraceae bacterium]
MSSVEIIGFAPSTYVRAARMVCEEKASPYELKASPPHSPEVAAIHPFGKIPVMRHGDFALCESKAIATYLDLAFPGPLLYCVRNFPEGAAAIAAGKAVSSYYDRFAARESFKKTTPPPPPQRQATAS